MKPVILTILLSFSLLARLQAQITLKGVVTNDDCTIDYKSKGCRLFPNVRITVGAMGTVTDDNGRFVIQLPSSYIAGSDVIANVNAKDYAVFSPMNGRFNLPNVLLENVFELQVVLLPRGSLKFLTNANLTRFIAEISRKENQRSKTDPIARRTNPDRYLQEFADFHGFTREQVKQALDHWANVDSNKNNISDLTLQGARNYYL